MAPRKRPGGSSGKKVTGVSPRGKKKVTGGNNPVPPKKKGKK